MNTLLTIAFFAALGLINWFAWARSISDVRISMRLYGSILLGALCVATLISVYLAWGLVVVAVLGGLYLLVRSRS